MATTELVPSVSIDNLVNQRAAVLERIEQAVVLIREAATIAQAANIGMPRFLVTKTYNRGMTDTLQIATSRTGVRRDGSAWDHEPCDPSALREMVRNTVDCAGWQWLMHHSGLRSLMDQRARKEWDENIANGTVAELTRGNVYATFRTLHAGRVDMFERGVIECFRSLSWNHKTNLPQKFGKRIVMAYLRRESGGSRKFGSGAFGSVFDGNANSLDDLSRVFHILDGRPEPDHRRGWYTRLSSVRAPGDPDAEDDYMRVRCYLNGAGHVTFKRPDLVDQMNRILAKHYPGALPEPK